MSDRAQMQHVLEQVYRARVRADIDAICGLFCDDVHFRIAAAPTVVAAAPEARGTGLFRSLVGQLIKTYEMSDLKILSMLIEGSKAAVHWSVKIRSSITGEVVTTELFDLVEFREGKIASLTEFCDTALAARLTMAGMRPMVQLAPA